MSAPRPIVMMFPGQGAQQPRMAAGLYDAEPTFTATMNTAFDMFGAMGRRLRTVWLDGDRSDPLADGRLSQPLLYAVNCALGRTLVSWGMTPQVLIGHSVGEMCAAVFAGILDFEDGIRVIHDRAADCDNAPAGGMCVAACSPEEAEPYLGDGVVVGAHNSARQVMLAGPEAALARVRRALRDDGYTCYDVHARQPFHSPAMAPLVPRATAVWRTVALRPARRTLYTAYRGGILPDALACDPRFWARQIIDPVLFGPTLNRLLDDGDHLLVEVGPGQSLTMLARRTAAVAGGRSAVVATQPTRTTRPDADRAAIEHAASRVAAEGHDLADTAPIR